MKKILLAFITTLCLCFLTACAEPPKPANVTGGFPRPLNNNEVEDVLYQSCLSRGWYITGRMGNSYSINLDHKEYNFDAFIDFDPTGYAIRFGRVNDTPEDLKYTYRVYKKYIHNLNKSIQKFALKYARGQ